MKPINPKDSIMKSIGSITSVLKLLHIRTEMVIDRKIIIQPMVGVPFLAIKWDCGPSSLIGCKKKKKEEI